MMTANEARKLSDKIINDKISKEVPQIIEKICGAINQACELGDYNCYVEIQASKYVVENIICQLKEMGYRVTYSNFQTTLQISWEGGE